MTTMHVSQRFDIFHYSCITTRNLPIALRVEESGCVSELQKIWQRYGDNHFDVFHLSGHASIAEDGQPFFITETEMGDRHDATAPEIAEALRFRLPRLVFLSGCRTGQAGDQGATPSMAEALLGLGLQAVLGWGLPVYDTVAIAAAAFLYEALAKGLNVMESVVVTYQKLREQKISSWYLLRLYARGDLAISLAAVVAPMGDRLLPLNSEIEQLFLDPNDATTPRVVRREDFVGRRRILQRCLRRLASNDLGVFLHGMGGLGKTTIAKRLLERMADPQNSNYDPIFIYRELDEAKLVRELSRQCTSELGLEILNGKLPLMQRLTKFLQEGMNAKDHRFMFVLDDFEANLEDVAGVRVLLPQVVEPLMALVEAIARSRLPHKLMITCRYDFELPDPKLNRRLHREALAGLRGADLRKKCDRLGVFEVPILLWNASASERQEVAELAELQQQAIAVADGNPRLLEWLAAILPSEVLTVSQKQAVLDRMQAQASEFREQIMAQTLLDQQSEDLRRMLARGLVFDLPVPESLWVRVCAENLSTHQRRAIAIGLLAVDIPHNAPDSQALLRVPKILADLLPPQFSPELYATAAHELYRVWWEESETSTEEQMLEIHRLAILATEKEIAIAIGNSLAENWRTKSRFREAVNLCKNTLEVARSSKILNELAYCEQSLGNVEKAAEYYQQAINECSEDDEYTKAFTFHCFGMLKAQQGEVEQAIALYQQSLEIKERIGDVQGKAATLHGMATIYAQQGSVEQAIALYQQVLEITDRIGDVQGKAATLSQMAGIYAQQGAVEQAIALSLEIEESIGNVQGKAATLAMMGDLLATQGDFGTAISYLQQSLSIFQHLKSPDAATVQSWLQQVQQRANSEL